MNKDKEYHQMINVGKDFGFLVAKEMEGSQES